MTKTAIGKWAGIWLAVLGGGMSVHATGHSIDQAKEIEQNQVFEIDVDVKTGKVIKVESENV
ncbi:hypothetical protein [Brevibacillus fortis]|uniref:hypothetical protein n=1 Tax=Brevibacillus fortis TaxID=2126352 RepID=UPI0038FBF86C